MLPSISFVIISTEESDPVFSKNINTVSLGADKNLNLKVRKECGDVFSFLKTISFNINNNKK